MDTTDANFAFDSFQLPTWENNGVIESKPTLIFSLREQIVDQLRNDVLCGRFAEGERLNESKLAERFGVSRTPIREALQQLRQEGLVEGRPKVAPKVARRPADAARKLVVSFRRSIETFALWSFFTSLTEADFRRWDDILEKMKSACESQNYSSITEHDIAFHRSIVRRASQRDLEALWNALLAHFWKIKRPDDKDSTDIYQKHFKLVEVFRSGDAELAVKSLAEHID